MFSTISVRVIKTEPVEWRQFQFIQEDSFKELSETSKKRLRASILANEFTQPFYVWYDEASDVLYCLDGKHRSMILEELSAEGYDVPIMLPATFISCENKTEAAKLVLQFSSIYAKISEGGLFEFVESFDLNFETLNETIDLPNIETILPDINDPADPFNDEGIIGKSQYGVIVLCDNETDQKTIFDELTQSGHKCKIVVT